MLRARPLVLLAALGALAGCGGGQSRLAKTPEAGSRFGATPVHRGTGIMEALAPVLRSDDRPAPGPSAPRSVRDLATRLPLRRQVMQLFLVGFRGQSPTTPFVGGLATHDWGGVLVGPDNYGGPQSLANLTGAIAKAARDAHHVPPLIAAAQPGGPASAFPNLPPAAPAALAAGGITGVVKSAAVQAGAQLRVLGLSMNLAPAADVAVEGSATADVSFGSDPATVARLVRAAVGGYAKVRMVSAVGHFPGQGTVSQDPADGPATVGASLADLRGRDLRAFAAVIRQAPVVVMSDAAYAAWDGVTPAALLPDAVKLLRGMGFRGVVMADELGDAADAAGEPIGQAAVDALKAGDDLLLVSGPASDQDAAVSAVMDAVHRGELPRARIRESLLRLLELKRRYGLIKT